MWDTMSKAWQVAFEQGWEALKNGSIPIGASITDKSGTVISFGRNRIYEGTCLNPKVAHAETEAIQKLNVSKYSDIWSYTLYTCMEPCFMCVGTILMSNLKNVYIAAKDSYCGAAHYFTDDSYIASKGITVSYTLGTLEFVQLVMQSYFELKTQNGEQSRVIKFYEKYYSAAVETAAMFIQDSHFERHISNETPFSEVFNEIAGYER